MVFVCAAVYFEGLLHIQMSVAAECRLCCFRNVCKCGVPCLGREDSGGDDDREMD